MPKTEQIVNNQENKTYSIIKDGVLLEFDDRDLEAGRYDIPEGVVAIGCLAFQDSAIKAITIPDSVKSIGMGAFINCRSLKNIKFPNGLKLVPTGACSGCVSLKRAIFSDSVVEIGDRAFAGCENLTLMTLNNVQTVGCFAFKNNRNLVPFIADKLVSAKYGAFVGCREDVKKCVVEQIADNKSNENQATL